MSKSPAQLLLQLRSLREQLAQRHLTHTRSLQIEAEQAAARTAARIAAHHLPDRVTPAEFMASAAARQALVGLVLSQREQVEVARDATEMALLQWSETDRDREAVHRMVEQERLERRAERARLEQRESDDLATIRHGALSAGDAAPTDPYSLATDPAGGHR